VIRALVAAVIVAAGVGVTAADPMMPSGVYVVDGDTIEALGSAFGASASTPRSSVSTLLERVLAARATSRLRQMIQLSNDIDLQIVDCSCRPGTAGTMACNYGRSCGYLTVDGQDVGDVLIAENLAHPLVCGKYSCPRRQSWCPSFAEDTSYYIANDAGTLVCGPIRGLPERLRQSRDFDGDPSRLVFREHFRLPRFGFVVPGVDVRERLPIGVPDELLY
jgi:hypothetical protein